MSRARGANALLALAFETSYGVPPGSGYFQMPFVSANLGEEQNLITSDLLGQGRDTSDPSLDVITNDGDIVVPVDLRSFGQWLKALLGAPTTTAGIAAAGSIVFSAQPATSATITINASAFTFVTSGADATHILIGPTLADTITNAVFALNASTDTNVTPASYAADALGTTINVTYDTLGTSGNSFTLAASSSPASHGTVSGATLSGGSASGAYRHVFASGAASLPSLSSEVGFVDVPAYCMNFGGGIDKLAISLQRSGLLNATVSTMFQGELAPTGSTGAGSPTTLLLERFTQFKGSITRQGVTLGDVVSGDISLANNLDKVEVIRQDGRISGVDPGSFQNTGSAVTRFKDLVLYNLATNATPIDLTYAWSISALKSLSITNHRVFLPKAKKPITGPAGIQSTFNWQGAKDPTAGRAVTVTLVNDVTSYA